jgi:outer membrane receptor protein involved in Fe transport
MDSVKKFTGFLLLPVLLFGQELNSGRIQGLVIDLETREPLAGVNIIVSDTERGASTALNGEYVIEKLPVGTYRLEINYIGYITQKVTDIIVSNNKPTVVNVKLSQQILESENIVVTAGYFVEETMTTPSTIGLNREEIRRFPGGFEDVVRTVSTLPGIAINYTGGRNDLLVRGGGPSENLFVINNIEVPNINHFGTQGTSSGSLSFINLDFVDNVSFSTGGFSAEYGDKMSSVLSLDMSRGRNDKLGGKALISATQYGLNLEGPLGSAGDFIFSARQSYLDLIFKAADLPFVPVYTDFNFLMNYHLSAKDKLFLVGLAALDRVDRNLSTEENRVKNAGIMDNTQDQLIGGVNYRHLMNTSYLDVTFNYSSYDYHFSQIDEFGEQYFNSEAVEDELGLKIQYFTSFGKKFNLLTGIASRFVKVDNNTVFADTIYNSSGQRVPVNSLGIPQNTQIKAHGNKYVTYLNADWHVFPRLTLDLGLRVDYYSFLENPFYFSPRLNLKYKLTNSLSIKGSLGKYYQSPSYVWMVNEENRNLKALQNNMAILGIDYMLKDDLRLSVESFYKSYGDLPTGTLPDINDYLVITNTGTVYGGSEDDFQSFGYFPMVSDASGIAYGFEWLLQKKFSDIPCYGQISLAYSKSEYTAGNGLTYPGQFDQRFIMNVAGGYKFNGNWEISSKYRYFTGVPFTPVYRPQDNTQNPGSIQNVPEEYLTDRLNAQGIWDLRVDRYFYFCSWRLVVFLDIQNVLNNKYEIKPRYDFWEDEVVTQNSIGILPTIGISAEF